MEAEAAATGKVQQERQMTLDADTDAETQDALGEELEPDLQIARHPSELSKSKRKQKRKD